MKKIVPVFFFCSFIFLSTALAQDAPQYFVLTTLEEVLAQSRDNRNLYEENRLKLYKMVINHAETHIATTHIAERLVGSRWESLTAMQRISFESAFIGAMVCRYGERALKYSRYRIVLVELSSRSGRRASIHVQLDAPVGKKGDGRAISMMYHLLDNGQGWKIYNVEGSGVSLMILLRVYTVFGTVLYGFEGFLENIKKKSKCLE